MNKEEKEWVAIVYAAEKLDVGVDELTTKLKNKPELYRYVEDLDTVLINMANTTDIRQALIRETGEIDDGSAAIIAQLLSLHKKLDEGIGSKVDDPTFVPELQNAINQINNRLTDQSQLMNSVSMRLTRIETKVHNLLSCLTESKDGKIDFSKIEDILHKKNK